MPQARALRRAAEVPHRRARIRLGDVRGDGHHARRLPARRSLHEGRSTDELRRHALGDPHGALHRGTPPLRARARVLEFRGYWPVFTWISSERAPVSSSVSSTFPTPAT